MSLQKKQVFNMPAFIDAITQLVKDGYTIDRHHTRASYGGYYSIAYSKIVEQDISAITQPVAADATIEALEATDVLPEEDNPTQQATDTLELIKDVEIDLDAELPEEYEETISREDELKALTVKELREVLKQRGISFAPAAKESKLIELILGSE